MNETARPALIMALPGNGAAAAALAAAVGGTVGALTVRRFPDGESYLRFDTDVVGRDVVLVCTLSDPDAKLPPLLFAAATARELGARRVVLVAPYLAYMRQDVRFEPGEAVTSRHVARLLSQTCDALVTVDPHLHRYASLADIYTIPARAAHAAPQIARWIIAHVADPVVIGPDSESAQWVKAVAGQADAPYAVLEKVRHGDRDVAVSIRHLQPLAGRTPVLVDDIISTGRTLLATIGHLKDQALAAPVCIAVHGLFAGDAFALLERAGARVVTCNTVPHASNAIDVTGVMAATLQDVLTDAS